MLHLSETPPSIEILYILWKNKAGSDILPVVSMELLKNVRNQYYFSALIVELVVHWVYLDKDDKVDFQDSQTIALALRNLESKIFSNSIHYWLVYYLESSMIVRLSSHLVRPKSLQQGQTNTKNARENMKVFVNIVITKLSYENVSNSNFKWDSVNCYF